MTASPNLKLPFLDPNQSQKTVTHNAALTVLDALVNLHVASTTLQAPPASPNDGQCWIVASGGTGAWLGKDLNVAAWQDGAWSFYAPNPGFVAYVDALGGALMWNGSAWVSLIQAITQLSLNGLGLGTAVDASNPLSAKLNAALFSAVPTTASPAGTGDVRVKLSKQTTGNTASLLFQDNFSGRAEIGLAGDDNLHVKVSPDGNTFYDAMVVTAAGGSVAFLGTPTHLTPAAGDNSTKSATTAFVVAAVAAGGAVTSVAGRTGAVTLAVGDVTGAAPLASPALTGTPTVPTAAAGTSTGQVASTAFVAANFVTYAYASASYATSASPTLTGTPTAPTPAAKDNSTKIATTAYADRAVSAAQARTQVADAAYTVLVTDRTVAVVSLTAARTLSLPAASAYPAGATLTIVDESGACSPVNALTVAAAGSDLINGAASAVLSTPYGYLALESNTSNKWTILDQPAAYGWTAPQGRLTLQSATPVPAASVSGASGIVYTPYCGNLVGLWNGTQFVTVPFTEVGQSLSDATKSPSAAAAGQVYDMFAWMDGTTFRVTRGPAWTAGTTAGTTTARGQGSGSTQIIRVQGVLVNQYAITNGPAAGFGTYLGTIATDSGGATVTFNLGGASAGGTAAVVGLWNAYNRVPVSGQVRDTTSSWSYATAAWRAADGSSAMRVTFVTGQAEDAWEAAYDAIGTVGSGGGWAAGIGINSTTALSGISGYSNNASLISQRGEASSVPFGLTYMSAVEYANGGTLVAQGTGGTTAVLQSGMAWRGRY